MLLGWIEQLLKGDYSCIESTVGTICILQRIALLFQTGNVSAYPLKGRPQFEVRFSPRRYASVGCCFKLCTEIFQWRIKSPIGFAFTSEPISPLHHAPIFLIPGHWKRRFSSDDCQSTVLAGIVAYTTANTQDRTSAVLEKNSRKM